MNCNDTMTFLKEVHRMCKSYEDCMDCPAQEYCDCHIGTEALADIEAEAIPDWIRTVQKWANKHPHKTYKEDLLEKFPNAPFCNIQKDTPLACRKTIYGECDCPSGGCVACWNEPFEEGDK